MYLKINRKHLPNFQAITRFAIIAAVFAASLIAYPMSAKADRRIFPNAYPYMTLPKGGMELEHYIDAHFTEMDDPMTPDIIEENLEVDWQHQIEFEYGLTDNWDFGFYNVFRERPFESMTYRGVKLRTRYRFGDEGDLPLDPAVYLEVAYFDDEVEIEQRLILGKVIDSLEFSLNIKFEEEFKEEEPGEWETEYKLNPIFGMGYHIHERIAVGVEYFAFTENEHDKWGHYIQYAGPTVSFATEKFFWTLGAHHQVTDYDDEPLFQVRSLFGIFL